MATEKRDRQKANREAKKEAEAKAKRRRVAFARARRWLIYGLLIVGVFVLLNLLSGR